MKKSADWRIEACCGFEEIIGAVCITLRPLGEGVLRPTSLEPLLYNLLFGSICICVPHNEFVLINTNVSSVLCI